MDRKNFWQDFPEEMHDWPLPTEQDWQRSQMLEQRIIARIQDKGPMPFVDFMEAALYTPKLGYYANDAEKFGEQGDFTTAPNISPLFAHCVAKQCQQVLELLDEGSVVEVGAGNGQMACDILLFLEKEGCLPSQYLIIERSVALRQVQRQTLEEKANHCLNHVIWVDEIPNNLNAIVIANELLDALPAHRFKWSKGQCYSSFIAVDDKQRLYEMYIPENDALLERVVNSINTDLADGFFDGQHGEVNLNALSWLENVAARLQKGMVLILDYGYPQQEYYHPQRKDGTRKCFYRQHQHNDPFVLMGLQDISCHVNFTALVQLAVANGLDLSGFSTQAGFLVGCGITQQLNELTRERESQTLKESVSLSSQMDTLLSPGGMGELVKAIGFQKNLDNPMIGFSFQDMSFRL